MYEEVDEQQYSKMVQDRQEDDWIVDDGESPLQHLLQDHAGVVKWSDLILSPRWNRICGGRERNLR